MARKKVDLQRNGLLCVKSVMTIALTVMLCILVYMYPDSYAETFKSCIVMVVTFYFTHQIDKKGSDSDAQTGPETSQRPVSKGGKELSALEQKEENQENQEGGGKE